MDEQTQRQQETQRIINITEAIMECNGYSEGAAIWLGPRLNEILDLAKSMQDDKS